MSKQRQFNGEETTEALSNWTRGPKAAERLASSVLQIENFDDIDPSHPLGGRDGKKDIICKKNGKKLIVAVYFPNSKKAFSFIKKKVQGDFEGVSKNNADGIIIFTNQYLTIGQRTEFKNLHSDINVEIFHLERIASILNSPIGYGVRLEFLDIELSKPEQLAYFAHKDKDIKLIQTKLSDLLDFLNQNKGINDIRLIQFLIHHPIGIILYKRFTIHHAFLHFGRLAGPLTGFFRGLCRQLQRSR
jgi:hypothetical protein